MNTLWHGLTDEELVASWDRHAWRTRIAETLITIAENPRALATQRVAALHMLNENISSGVLDPKITTTSARLSMNRDSFPEFLLSILQLISSGVDKNVGWRARRAQKKIEEQLTGANYLLRFVGQFIPDKRLPTSFEPKSTPKLDALLS